MGRPRTEITPLMFAELVAALRDELANAPSPGHRAGLLARPRKTAPRAFDGRWWARQRVSREEASVLTGLAPASLRRYASLGRTAAADGTATHRSMPLEHPSGGWPVGTLALWVATRDDTRAASPGRPSKIADRLPQVRELVEQYGGRVPVAAVGHLLGIQDRHTMMALLAAAGASPYRPSDEELTAALRPVVEKASRRLLIAEVQAVLDEAGLHTSRERARRALLAAGGRGLLTRDPGSAHLLPLESLRNDGRVTAGQLAQVFEVTPQAVTNAIKAGRLRVADRDPYGHPLFDPARIRIRVDARPGPVDMTHPKASPQPLPVPGG